jgi:hypothetical protein
MSKFGERIQLWEARMAVALEEEQRHREFNTRVYGDELLEQFGGGVVGTEIDFTQVGPFGRENAVKFGTNSIAMEIVDAHQRAERLRPLALPAGRPDPG